MLEIDIDDRQDAVSLSPDEVRQMFAAALEAERRNAVLNVSIVDDEEMTALNGRFLERSGATDVLAFPYDCSEKAIEGEIVVNAERAARVAAEHPHSAEDELMLYLAHGLLHLLGCDDHCPEDTDVMRRRESEVLAAVGRHVEF